MQWDVSIVQATLLTLLIGTAVAISSTFLALALSLATFWFRIPGWKYAIGLLSSFLLVPLYVQATAWSAGFGSQGWFRFSQVDASKSSAIAIASVVWIHTCAALPFCFWIQSLGLRRSHDATVDQALVELGSWYTLRHQVLPKLRLWIFGSLLWAFASVQYDMVVTNLFQTPTLCESVYQQVQFGKLRSGPIWIAWGIAILCGVALAAGVFRYGFKARHRSRTVSTKMPHVRIPALHRWGLASLSWVVLGICCIVPWLSLISRMGLRSTALEGRFVRVWSIADCGSALWHVQDFREEFGWSFQLSLWSVGLSFALGGMLIWMTSRSVRPAWVFGVLGCMLVTPGPLINLVVGQLLNRWLPSSFGFLSDRTLLGPILGLQFRVLPVVFGLLWTMRQQYIERYGDLLQLENQLPVKNRWYASIRYTQWGWVIAFLVGFSIAFGDLASYLLVQPPGVTTVAMRMFDLLHYGTKNREAGLAVVLACLGAASSLAIVRAVPQRR